VLHLVRNRKTILCCLVGLFFFALQLSCGKKANPVAPVKVLPKGVDNFSAQVKGKSLIVSWTIPVQNTDGSPLIDLKEFKFFKGQWPTKDFCPTCPDQFQETRLIQLKGPLLPDVKIETDRVEMMLEGLRPGQTYFFQVVAVTKKDTASQPSPTLKVPWDLPLRPPSHVEVALQLKEVQISWKPSPSLVDGSLPQGLIGYVLYRRTGNGPWVKISGDPIKGVSFVDKGLRESEKVTYQVKALRQVEKFLLESEGSEEKSIVYTYKGPPPVIEDLLGVPGPKGIELRWQRLETVPHSGYYVYKRSGDDSEAKRITPERITETTFLDEAVVPGGRYFYSLTVAGPPPALEEGPKSKEIEINYLP